MNRYITKDDRELLEKSLSLDEYHKDTSVDFFYEHGTVCSVFEDEQGVVLFVRGSFLNGFLVLDIQFVNNYDAKRNLKVMLEGFPLIESRAKENKFFGFIFNSQTLLLRKFCVKRLGFKEFDENLLYKFIQDVDKTPSGVI